MKTTLEIAREYDLNGQLFEEFVVQRGHDHTALSSGEIAIEDAYVEKYVNLYHDALAAAAKKQPQHRGSPAEGALRAIGVLCILVAVIYGIVGGAEGLLLITLPAVIFATVLFAVADILKNQRKILEGQQEILKKLK